MRRSPLDYTVLRTTLHGNTLSLMSLLLRCRLGYDAERMRDYNLSVLLIHVGMVSTAGATATTTAARDWGLGAGGGVVSILFSLLLLLETGDWGGVVSILFSHI